MKLNSTQNPELNSLAQSSSPDNCTQSVGCKHCGLEVPMSRLGTEGQEFCCAGCKSVYAILQGLGLGNYYQIKEATASSRGVVPTPGAVNYSYFDDPEFLQEHVVGLENFSQVRLYLSGVHCAACVWVLEKLPQLVDGVVESRISLTDSVLTLRYIETQIKLSELATFIDSLGYQSRPLGSEDYKSGRKRERKMLLLRIAVAAVCAGNVMMIAISLYQGWFTGIESKYSRFFHYWSFVLTLPVILFSATPFYRAALAGLKTRTLHIDLPISIGILGGFILSSCNTLIGSAHVYYDSVCMLVLLLLAGRWLQRDGLDRAADTSTLLYTLASDSAFKKQADSSWLEVYAATLSPGDIVRVDSGTRLAADGVVLSERAYLDCSMLTGESREVEALAGQTVYAGTKNCGSVFEMSVTASHHNSRLGRLIHSLEFSQQDKPQIAMLTDKVAKYFVVVVLGLSFVTAVYWYLQAGVGIALERTLALLVVSCPCALGLAAPISFSVALRRAAQFGIYIKTANVLERLCGIEKAFLDKTGTITKGESEVVAVAYRQELISENELKSWVRILERNSQHPVGLALNAWASEASPPSSSLPHFENVEIFASGVELVSKPNARQDIYRLGSLRWCEKHLVDEEDFLLGSLANPEFATATISVLLRDSRVLAVFAVGDTLKTEAIEVFRELRKNFRSVAIISGDRREVVEQIAKQVGVPVQLAYSELAPEDKVDIVRQAESSGGCVMIGDGANDAAALQTASVGIALHGGAELSMKVADVYVHANDLGLVVGVKKGADATLRVIRRNLMFSCAYNISGAIAAILGLIGPLGAAILMPISSATVVLSALSLRRSRWTID